MMTRSGLSILKVKSDAKPSSDNPTPTPKLIEERCETTKKQTKARHKSLNHISFVTRVHLCHKQPDIEFPGISRNRSSSTEVHSFYEAKRYVENDDDSDDDDLKSDLDGFILDMSKNINNNTSVDKIIENKSEWIASMKNSTDSHYDKTVCPLATFFANNRLPESVTTSGKAKDTSGMGFCKQTQRNTQNFVDIDSEDASSIGSDAFYDFDSAPLLQVTQDCGSPMSQTKILKLRDAELRIQFVDGYEGDKLIKCGECEKVFTVMSAYMAHLRTHMNSKSTCFLCGKSFSRSWLLKGHMRTHTGEKPFLCPQKGCNKSFADKSNLRSHTMIHNVTKKEHKCESCGRSFAQKRYLHKHMQEVCRIIP